MTESYSRNWFAERAARADNDWRLMVPDIVCALGKCPESVTDLGCGDGASLRWFREAGAKSLVGVDPFGPDDWSRGIGLHVRRDLTQPFDLGKKAELVVCVEVAEHLAEEHADTLVENLVRHGDRILFSAAPPGQGGSDHVNEQPIEYWQRKFAKHGYQTQDIFRHRLHGEVSPWYRQNLFLVARPERLVRVPNTKITMARYRDSFKEVDDAVAELRHDPRILMGVKDGINIGAFTRPDSWQLLDDIEELESVCNDAPHESIKRAIDDKRRRYLAQHSRLLEDVYMSNAFASHELNHSAEVGKVRSELGSEFLDMREWDNCDYALHIDTDMALRPQQAIDLVVACHENNWDACTANYVVKQEKARIVHKPPIDKVDVAVGPYAKPYRVPGIGYGFVVVSKRAFQKMADERVNVDRTYYSDGTYVWDMFRQRLGDIDLGAIDPITGWATRSYLSEDYSWSSRATELGIDIWVQPQVLVQHIGRKSYGLENLMHLSGK